MSQAVPLVPILRYSVPAQDGKITVKHLLARKSLLLLYSWDHTSHSCWCSLMGRDQPLCLAAVMENPNNQTRAQYLEQQVPLWKWLPVDLQMCLSIPSWGSGLIQHAVANIRTYSCK